MLHALWSRRTSDCIIIHVPDSIYKTMAYTLTTVKYMSDLVTADWNTVKHDKATNFIKQPH